MVSSLSAVARCTLKKRRLKLEILRNVRLEQRDEGRRKGTVEEKRTIR
jgi:hypothetical protein